MGPSLCGGRLLGCSVGPAGPAVGQGSNFGTIHGTLSCLPAYASVREKIGMLVGPRGGTWAPMAHRDTCMVFLHVSASARDV